jgi:microcystin-dependent protein
VPTPEKPDLDYSYTAYQQAQGNNTFPGTQLDNDLANLKQSIDETIDFASEVIRDDGKLQNGVVTKNSLAEDVLLGVAAPRPWVTATEYAVDDTATINNSLYICLVEHTSGVFADDLAAGKWTLLIEFTVPSNIPDGSVTEPKHATGGVSTRALAPASVTPDKIPDASIPRAKMAANFGLMPIGAEIEWSGPLAPAGWVFKAGQALSRATYPDLMSALTAAVVGNLASGNNTITGLVVDLRNLGLEGAPIEGPQVPVGTTVASVTQTTIVMSQNASGNGTGTQVRIFPNGNGDGSTTFNVPDDKDRVGIGRGNMGGTAANRITATGNGNPGLDTTRLGVAGGVDRHTLTAAQVPALSGTADSAGAHQHGYDDTIPAGTASGTTGPNYTALTGPAANADRATDSAGAHTHTVTVNTSGGQAHPNVQPGRVVNKIIFTGVV